MRRIFLIAVAFLACLAPIASARADQSVADARALQGSWAGMYAEQNGEQLALDDVGLFQALIRNDYYLIAFSPQSIAIGQFQLNTLTEPKQINVTVVSGADAGTIYEGIYQIRGSTHQICLAPPGMPRPVQFSTFPGSGYSLYVWLRAERSPLVNPWPQAAGNNF